MPTSIMKSQPTVGQRAVHERVLDEPAVVVGKRVVNEHVLDEPVTVTVDELALTSPVNSQRAIDELLREEPTVHCQ